MRFFSIAALITILSLGMGIPTSAQDLDPEVAKDRLKDRGVDFTRAAYQNSITEGEAENVHLFLEAGMSPTIEMSVGKYELPVIDIAVSEGHTEVVETLIQHGADPNSPGIGSPLIHSSIGHPETMRALIKYGASLNSYDPKGYRPLHSAVLNSGLDEPAAIESMRVLLEAGASPEVGLKEGADHDLPPDKVTPMVIAAIKGSREAAELLIEYGAEPSTVAIKVARARGHTELAEYLQNVTREEP